MKRVIHVLLLLMVVGIFGKGSAFAEGYPSSPITMVVAFAAGGPTDLSARLLAKSMSKYLNRSVVVVNMGGAAGNVGAARVAQAKPDGYTLLYGNIALAINPSLMGNVPYDPIHDFSTIGVILQSPSLLVARKDFPASTIGELKQLAAKRSDGLLIGTSGPGSPSGLCALLIKQNLGINLTLVPYRGSSQGMIDLMGGRIDLFCDSIATASGNLRAGQIKTFGITGEARSPLAPNIPTLAEEGLPGVRTNNWNALFTQKTVPAAVVSKLSAALQFSLKDPDFTTAIAKIGQEIVTGPTTTPSGGDQFFNAEVRRWSTLLKTQPTSN